MVGEAQNRDIRIGIGDLIGVDPSDIRDHKIRRVDAIDRDEVVAGKKTLELAAKVEVDSRQQDRRHVDEGNTLYRSSKAFFTLLLRSG